MAKAGRVDDVVFGQSDADGPIFAEIKFTGGESPLPVGWQGLSMQLRTEEAFIAALEAVYDKLTPDDLVLLQVAVGFKADPRYGSAFRTRCVGKSTIVDLTGLAAPISIG